jgi:hypothetical protein
MNGLLMADECTHVVSFTGGAARTNKTEHENMVSSSLTLLSSGPD